MKICTPETTILTNTNNSSQFQIKTSAKAFKILSDGLYSNKIEAIVRELCCNALDSHKEAGNKNPFEVYLPDTMEPMFRVIDEGTGIPDHEISDIYCTYFNSTKDNTNDYIGALGLGSKSPFSYTNSFNVISRYDGVESVYSAHLNNSGEPALTKMTSKQTEHRNGVEIQVPVNKHDFQNFKISAFNVLKYFDEVPNVYFGYKLSDVNNLYSSDATRVISDEYFSSGTFARGINAIMGNIKYPIYIDSIISSLSDEHKNKIELLQDIKKFEINSLIIKFDIGELDVTPNREALSYDPVTSLNLANKIINYYKIYVIKALNDLFSKCNNYRDVVELYSKYNSYDFRLERNIIEKTTYIKYKNEYVKDIIEKRYILTGDHLSITTKLFKFKRCGFHEYKENKYNSFNHGHYLCNIKPIAFWHNTKNSYVQKTKEYIQHPNKYVAESNYYLIGIYDKNSDLTEDDQFKEFKKLCDDAEINMIIQRDDINNALPKKVKEKVFSSYSFYNNSGIKIPEEYILDKLDHEDADHNQFVYVELNRLIHKKCFDVQPNHYSFIKNLLGIDIIFIPRTYVKRFNKNYPGVKPFISVLTKLYDRCNELLDAKIKKSDDLISIYLLEYGDIKQILKDYEKYSENVFSAIYGKAAKDRIKKDFIDKEISHRTNLYYRNDDTILAFIDIINSIGGKYKFYENSNIKYIDESVEFYEKLYADRDEIFSIFDYNFMEENNNPLDMDKKIKLIEFTRKLIN